MSTSYGGTDLTCREMFVGAEFSTEAEHLRQLRAYENATFRHLIIQDSHRNPSDFYVKYDFRTLATDIIQLRAVAEVHREVNGCLECYFFPTVSKTK
ncbi:hypothetical protein Smp_130290 [Schistosoma mansoni]|uniref:hypothetical protein n=1 Tax=Schistosoma mansoni TaxID=6183 RepID=UPI0001A63FCF|nr:hypothetical protein Smp_130290 [Schistosoma mansoni]|eukprot:XP_018651565.1 hypothetical protein Smp_130290 [Schistosoma mansoni]